MIQDILDQTELLYQVVKKSNQEEFVKQKINHKKYRILAHLLSVKNCSPSAISDRLFYDRPTTTILLKQLEEDGWIRREINQLNRRYVEVTLTSKGEKQIRAMILKATSSSQFDGVLEPQELQTLNNLLNKLLAAM